MLSGRYVPQDITEQGQSVREHHCDKMVLDPSNTFTGTGSRAFKPLDPGYDT